MAKVRKAVVPAAGRGSRFLPASKAIPKEMLPVVDRPAIQYVIEEAVAAGLDDIAIVTVAGKEAVAAHFEPNPELEAFLESKGETDLLEAVRAVSALGPFSTIDEGEPLGLGHAVGVAEEFVAGDPFAVLLGDDFCDERDPALPAMIALHELTGMSVILLLEVPQELVQMYGAVDAQTLHRADIPGASDDSRIPEDVEIHRLSRLHEKPPTGEEYSNLVILGRYVFNPAIFDVIRETPPGRGGEIQLTDALDRLARIPPDQGGGTLGLVFRGRRYDTGDKLAYLKAVVAIAADRPDLGPAFSEWLRDFVSRRDR
jgi:UTP--glucose-1-phosphate uridylyltransferase